MCINQTSPQDLEVGSISLSHVGFVDDKGVGNDGCLNIIMILLRKQTNKQQPQKKEEKAKRVSITMKERCINLMLGEYLLGNANYLRTKSYSFIVDILRLYVKALQILDKDGNGGDNDDVDDKHGHEYCTNSTSEGELHLNRQLLKQCGYLSCFFHLEAW